ncbi:hypothetical protein OROGR_001641 [Orobanche gracilis]
MIGFLPKHAGTRKEMLLVSANEATIQIFFFPPHKLYQFLEETSSVFGDSRVCVMARELTKIHEEFWRGTLGDAKVVFSNFMPKGEVTFLIEGKAICIAETPSECQLENELGELISNDQSFRVGHLEWYRRGKANASLGNYEDAFRDLTVAMNMELALVEKRKIENELKLYMDRKEG